MHLSEWLSISGLSYRKLADQLGVSKAYIGHLANGRNKPSIEVAAKILKITEGKVGLTDWVDELPDVEDVPFRG